VTATHWPIRRVNPQREQAQITGTIGQDFLNADNRLLIPNRFHLNRGSSSRMVGILPLGNGIAIATLDLINFLTF
jgi:hypothetical protein